MAQRLTEVDIRRLAARWREHQASLTGVPTPPVPPYLQAIADRCDAQLLLLIKPELADLQVQMEVNHV